RLGIGERRLLAFVVTVRALEIDQIQVIVFDQSSARTFHRTLVAAVFAFDRARDVNPTQLLDVVVGDAFLEHGAPAVGDRPESRGPMRAPGLAFGPRRTFAPAAVEFRQHVRILDGRGIDVADARLSHFVPPDAMRFPYSSPAGQSTLAPLARRP